jgi:membrane-associated phospholipid phosphatase
MRKLETAWLLALSLVVVGVSAPAGAQTAPTLKQELVSDFKFTANAAVNDSVDVATAPLHIADVVPILESPRFYLILGTAGALWGGSYALDQTMRAELKGMSSSNADMLQDLSYASVSAASALLYGWGLYSGDASVRENVITAGEGAGIASLLDIGIKDAFGRLRPYQSPSHTQFFKGGHSFVSGDVTPMFALAAGISESFNNAWYVAAPIYSLAMVDGFGRMGNDAHWFSDVIGGALLGIGTTELFLYLHRRQQENPHSINLFAVSAPPAGARAGQNPMAAEVGVAYNW